MELKFFYEPKAPPLVDGYVTYETGATPEQATNPHLFTYEHHTEGFGLAGPGALTCLYEDLSLGRVMPPSLVVNRINDLDTLVAATLFLHRGLLTLPLTVGFVAQVDLVHRRGYTFIGHLDPDLGRFVRLLRAYFPTELTPSEVNARLPTAVGWIVEYLKEGKYPSLGAPFPLTTVYETGPYGFVVAETKGSLPEGWFDLYRKGYSQGVLFGPRVNGTLLPVLISRKSAFVPLNIEHAAFLLNEGEQALGGAPRWAIHGDWLWSPPEGSLQLATRIVETLLSC